MAIRVIQWSTGNVGIHALRLIARHPDLELVGLWVHSPDKVGVDAGTLAGIEPTGVLATNDAAWFVAVTQLVTFKGTDVLRGTGKEFEAIIAAVIGGCLLTGGYGSVIGASLGAGIMAMSTNGVQSTGWNSDGRFAFLGIVLLLAVLVNNYTRKKAQEAR